MQTQARSTIEQPSLISPTVTRLPIKECMRVAWGNLYGAKKALFLAFLLAIVAYILSGFIYGFIHGFLIGFTHAARLPADAIDKSGTWIVSSLVLRFILLLVTALVAAGVLYLGIRRAANLSINVKMMFDVFRQATRIIILKILLLFIIVLLASLLFIPNILHHSFTNTNVGDVSATVKILTAICYLAVIPLFIFVVIRLSMALPLVLDRKLNPIKAIKLSFIGTRKNFWRLFLIQIVGLLAVALSVVTVGIAGIWLIPFIYILYGVVYQKLFGIAQQV